MSEEKPSAIEAMMKAYEESNGEYVDLTVEHGELPGITLEQFRWWGINMHTPELYRMWHPQDHISHQMKTETDKNGNTVTMLYAEEKIGDYSASMLRIRMEDPDASPVRRVYKPMASGTMLGPDDEEIGGVYHECEETPSGLKMHSTFRLPARIPQEFLDAMYRHSKTEMANLPKFLPKLYAEATGNK
jgi:hypothetical protein